MPYINKKSKLAIDHQLDLLLEIVPKFNEGELNYVISRICDTHLLRGSRINYGRINSIIGVLECAKMEIYRRLATPYEDAKRDQNGEVFESASQLVEMAEPITEVE